MRHSEKLDVLDHYVAWRQTHDMPQHASGTDGPFSFCSYSFLLNPRAKSKLLHTEARIQMDQVRKARRQYVSSCASNGAAWYAKIRLIATLRFNKQFWVAFPADGGTVAP